MDRKIQSIETLAEFKRAMKAFVRGTIKAKIFTPESGPMTFVVEKDENFEKCVTIGVCNGTNYAEFVAEVSTRVYNKVVPELFTKTIEQFNKLKGFNGMTVIVEG